MEGWSSLQKKLCALSRDAWKVWVKAGQPLSGQEFGENCRLRREVRQRVRFCAGKTERLRLGGRILDVCHWPQVQI